MVALSLFFIQFGCIVCAFRRDVNHKDIAQIFRKAMGLSVLLFSVPNFVRIQDRLYIKGNECYSLKVSLI